MDTTSFLRTKLYDLNRELKELRDATPMSSSAVSSKTTLIDHSPMKKSYAAAKRRAESDKLTEVRVGLDEVSRVVRALTAPSIKEASKIKGDSPSRKSHPHRVGALDVYRHRPSHSNPFYAQLLDQRRDAIDMTDDKLVESSDDSDMWL